MFWRVPPWASSQRSPALHLVTNLLPFYPQQLHLPEILYCCYYFYLLIPVFALHTKAHKGKDSPHSRRNAWSHCAPFLIWCSESGVLGAALGQGAGAGSDQKAR